MLISLCSCGDGDSSDTVKESSTLAIAEESESYTEEITDTTENTDNTQVSASVVSEIFDDPADWSKEQIVEIYKAAAEKSNATAVSDQKITLTSISVNNGQYEGLFDFITPIMSKLLANNSKQKDGITGGFRNLTVSDLLTAKALTADDGTVVEMKLRNQTSGADDDALSGSVGHAITAVGDIGVVTNQLKDLGLPLEFSDEDTKIHYTDAYVKVLINDDGRIVNGTWFYTVEIRLDNYKAFGKAVETTSVIMDNTVTVNGGFAQ